MFFSFKLIKSNNLTMNIKCMVIQQKQLLHLEFLMAQNINEKTIIEFGYWNIRGTGQPVRHLLEYLKAPYVQKKLELPQKWFLEDILILKKKCLVASLPYIKDGDLVIQEIVSIMKYLCKKFNRRDLIGKNLQDQVKITEILGKFIQHRNRTVQIFHFQINDQIKKKQFLQKMFFELLNDQYFKILSNSIKKNGWILQYITIADFFVYQTCFYLSGIFPQVLAEYTYIKQYMQRFQSIPHIEQYRNSERMTYSIVMKPFQYMKRFWRGDQKYIKQTK